MLVMGPRGRIDVSGFDASIGARVSRNPDRRLPCCTWQSFSVPAESLGYDRLCLLGHQHVAAVGRVPAPVGRRCHRDDVGLDGRGERAAERGDDLVAGRAVCVGDRPHSAEKDRGLLRRVAVKASERADKVDVDVDKAADVVPDVAPIVRALGGGTRNRR